MKAGGLYMLSLPQPLSEKILQKKLQKNFAQILICVILINLYSG